MFWVSLDSNLTCSGVRVLNNYVFLPDTTHTTPMKGFSSPLGWGIDWTKRPTLSLLNLRWPGRADPMRIIHLVEDRGNRVDSRHCGSCPGLLTSDTEQARRTRELQGRSYLIHNSLAHQQSEAQVFREPVLNRLAIPPFPSGGKGVGVEVGQEKGSWKRLENT